MRKSRIAVVLVPALLSAGAAAHTHAQAAEPSRSSSPVAGVFSPRAPRSAGTDPELEDLQARFSALAYAVRARAADSLHAEAALARGREAIELARQAISKRDQAARGRLKQIGWAAVAVLARVLAQSDETRALQAEQARAEAARREHEAAREALRELQAQVDALRERVRQPATPAGATHERAAPEASR